MSPGDVRVGFLGFGEAGYRMARGPAGAGLDGIVAFEPFTEDPNAGTASGLFPRRPEPAKGERDRWRGDRRRNTIGGESSG